MIAESNEVAHRVTLLNRLAKARRQTDQLFAAVHPNALYERPIAERHRIIFYLGHLEAFDWNLLCPRMPGGEAFDEGLNRLFAFGIDPVDGGLPSDQPSDWPGRQHVEAYRTRVRAALDHDLMERSFDDWAGDQSPLVLLNVAIEHRLMHAETLAYMLHQLPYDQKQKHIQVLIPDAGPVHNNVIDVPSGRATLGLSRLHVDSFGWDNEYDVNAVDVPAFTIDQFKVTNADYLKFVEAGGYQDHNLWSPGAWAWKEKHGIAHPLFWSKAGDANGFGAPWRYRGMFDELPLPLDWPVFVSHAEASAYVAWRGKRLPTEAEWHRAAYGTPAGPERPFPWGAEHPGPERGYFDFDRWDPVPVNAFPAARSAFGVDGLLANGWEWTSSVFAPFPRFQPFPFYKGYSADFFDGLHYILKGGSPRTEQCMLRRSFRNWFQPHYQYVYAGFRCAEQ